MSTKSTSVDFSAGDVYFQQGDVPRALMAWQTQQPLSAQTQFELALRQSRAFREINDTQNALKNAQLAQQLAQSLTAHSRLLADVEAGLVQLSLSHFDTAQHILLKVREITLAQQLWTELAKIEAGLASVAQQKEQFDLAISHSQTAKDYVHHSQDRLLIASLHLAHLYVLIENNKPITESEWQTVISIVQALPTSQRRNFMLIGLARLVQKTNSPFLHHALGWLEQAAQSSSQLNDDRLLSYALGYQANYYEKQGNITKALPLTYQAIDAAQRANAVESLYLWEWQLARLHKMHNNSDSALAAYRRAVFNLNHIRGAISKGQSFRDTIQPLYVELTDLLLKKAQQTRSSAVKEALLQDARNTFEQLKTAELQDYFQDECVTRLKQKMQNLQSVSEKTAVLYPIILPDRVEILLGLHDGIKQFVIPIAQEKLVSHIRLFRYYLEKRTTFEYLDLAQQLYQLLINPLQAELKRHHVETLVIVPDGALRTIPFAALHDGKHYLIEQFALATTPSLSLTDSQTLSENHIDVLISGITESVQHFSPLPYVDTEVQYLQQQFNGTLLKNQQFTVNALSDSLEKHPYRIVHIASHGQFNRDAKKTFLLAYDGRITMDVLERSLNVSQYRDKSVELLTLSACQTAAGDDRSALGMAGVAVKAGAKSALASLWFINDTASSELMKLFYKEIQQGHSKAQALQVAQTHLLKNTHYHHASSWASFLLIGNWQ